MDAMKTYYLASSLDNAVAARDASMKLFMAGFQKTYDWTTHGRVEDKSELAEVARKEMQGVIDADFLVLLMPARFGSHVELGVALSLKIPVFLVENDIEYEEKSFYNLPTVRRYLNIDDLIKDLTK